MRIQIAMANMRLILKVKKGNQSCIDKDMKIVITQPLPQAVIITVIYVDKERE